MYSVAQHVYAHIIQVTTQAQGGASSYKGHHKLYTLKEFQWKPQEIKTLGEQNVWGDLLEPTEAPIITILLLHHVSLFLSCLTLVKISATRTIAK